ncbi:hypothetical protein [Methanobacterium congolense]|uniref:Uncharacterized protein n=1 Tax=Methanobacterium congolense TaxID=118062 RepID=A0A1D3L1H3_9EURY|nr:hypothetical protein [Methanobacterium congolense]SCG85418.1 putative protein [Methanobacterium congolense]
MVKTEEFVNQIYGVISETFKTETIHLKGNNGVNNIVLFDEPELIPVEKSRYRIAYLTMAVFNGEKLILIVEAIIKAPTPPKEIVGPIPVCMITRKIIINKKNGQNLEYSLTDKNSKFLLLVVVPDQGEGSPKSDQISDLNEKFKGVLDLDSEYSNLEDFAICEISDIKLVLKKLLKDNL